MVFTSHFAILNNPVTRLHLHPLSPEHHHLPPEASDENKGGHFSLVSELLAGVGGWGGVRIVFS